MPKGSPGSYGRNQTYWLSNQVIQEIAELKDILEHRWGVPVAKGSAIAIAIGRVIEEERTRVREERHARELEEAERLHTRQLPLPPYEGSNT